MSASVRSNKKRSLNWNYVFFLGLISLRLVTRAALRNIHFQWNQLKEKCFFFKCNHSKLTAVQHDRFEFFRVDINHSILLQSHRECIDINHKLWCVLSIWTIRSFAWIFLFSISLFHSLRVISISLFPANIIIDNKFNNNKFAALVSLIATTSKRQIFNHTENVCENKRIRFISMLHALFMIEARDGDEDKAREKEKGTTISKINF